MQNRRVHSLMRALRALINLVICSKKIKHGDEPVANQAVESRSRSGYQHHALLERIWQEIHQLFFPMCRVYSDLAIL